jgi:ribosomal protein S18 acetylase RimI-like enzyme
MAIIALNDVDRLEWRYASGKTVEITDIVVGTERRKGQGRKLVESLLQVLRANGQPPYMVYAITRSSNAIAQEFYQGIGFKSLGKLDGFYVDAQEAAVVYGKDIT